MRIECTTGRGPIIFSSSNSPSIQEIKMIQSLVPLVLIQTKINKDKKLKTAQLVRAQQAK
jgi:hypothetical protein